MMEEQHKVHEARSKVSIRIIRSQSRFEKDPKEKDADIAEQSKVLDGNHFLRKLKGDAERRFVYLHKLEKLLLTENSFGLQIDHEITILSKVSTLQLLYCFQQQTCQLLR